MPWTEPDYHNMERKVKESPLWNALGMAFAFLALLLCSPLWVGWPLDLRPDAGSGPERPARRRPVSRIPARRREGDRGPDLRIDDPGAIRHPPTCRRADDPASRDRPRGGRGTIGR
jgi:hypothetical protein